MPRILLFVSVWCVLIVVFLGSGVAFCAETEIQPEWLTFNPARKQVELKITAALNGANGTLNFNGYANGEMAITVPYAWEVRIHFTVSGLGALPHSLLITKQFDQLPVQADREEVVFRGAYSRDPTAGIMQGSDTLHFRADKLGTFLLFCGVSGHGVMGMWDYFVVSKDIIQPRVTINKK
jgi:sulfocyanin